MSMEDIFSHFGDIFEGAGFDLGDIGEMFMGGRGRSRGSRVQRGSDMRVKVRLTLEEIAKGCEKKIKVRKLVACGDCHGTGSQDGTTETCPTCKGSGRVIRQQRGIFGMMQVQADCDTCNGEGRIIRNKCPKCGGQGVVQWLVAHFCSLHKDAEILHDFLLSAEIMEAQRTERVFIVSLRRGRRALFLSDVKSVFLHETANLPLDLDSTKETVQNCLRKGWLMRQKGDSFSIFCPFKRLRSVFAQFAP